jgi:hypothetical protein
VTALELVGYPNHAGGLSNVATIVGELAESLDAGKLLEVARQSPISWSQRLGYILELVGREELAKALEFSLTRKVRNDLTLDVDGETWELTGRHLAGRKVDIVIDPFTRRVLRASVGGVPVPVGRCDPHANARRRRADKVEPPAATAPLDPIAALLAKAREVDHE